MASFRELQQAHLRASLAAARQHAALATDQSQRVDIFGIIERDGVWLAFQNLDVLYGLFLRDGETTGIVLNAHHPLSLQRYTAAHEYGHYVLNHSASADAAEQIIYRRGKGWRGLDLREVEAQTFAAYFLMPPEFVMTTLRRLHLTDPQDIKPVEAYKLSLELGASYSATATHLANLGVITRQAADGLLERQPRDIKIELGLGVAPETSRADVWPLREGDSGRLLPSRVDDELVVELPETPTSGYIWTLTAPAEGGNPPLIMARSTYRVPSNSDERHGERLGGTGWRQFVFRIAQPGPHHLQLVKRRPWQEGGPKETFDLTLDALAGYEVGVSPTQRALLAA